MNIQHAHHPSKVLAILLTSVCLDAIGFGIVLPFMPFYAKSFGASPLEIGVLLGIHPLISIIAPPLWGNLSDRLGRRLALLCNIAGTAVSFVCLSLANSLLMLFVARVIAGASSSSMVIAQSYVSVLVPQEKRTKTLGWLQAVAVLGFAIGPALGGLFVGNDPNNPQFHLPGLVAAAAAGFNFCWAFLALPRLKNQPANDSPTTQSPATQFSFAQFRAEIRQISQRPMIGSIMVLAFMVTLSSSGFQGILALWCEHHFGWSTHQFANFVTFYCLAIIIIQVSIVGRLANRLSEFNILLGSLSIMILGFVVFPLSTTLPLLIGAVLLLAFAQTTWAPALTSLSTQLSDVTQQGQTLGLIQSLKGFANFLGQVWAGFLFGSFGENWPFWSNAFLIAIATIFCWHYVSYARYSQLRRQGIHVTLPTA